MPRKDPTHPPCGTRSNDPDHPTQHTHTHPHSVGRHTSTKWCTWRAECVGACVVGTVGTVKKRRFMDTLRLGVGLAIQRAQRVCTAYDTTHGTSVAHRADSRRFCDCRVHVTCASQCDHQRTNEDGTRCTLQRGDTCGQWTVCNGRYAHKASFRPSQAPRGRA